jgi:hypothetical protein
MSRNKNPILLVILSISLTCILAACASKTVLTPIPMTIIETPAVSATVALTAPTVTPLPTATALAQLTPIIVEQPTTTVPTELAESFLDQKFPAALLNIYIPGPYSKISSPLDISAYAYPGDQGKVTLQLFGEDGRLMAEQLIQLEIPKSGWVSFSTRVPFEINSGGESALIALTTFDGYGRRVSVNSLPVILLQIGDSEIELPGFQSEPIEIKNLSANQTVSGGTLHIEGVVHPYNNSPLILELFKTNGAIVASRQVSFKALPVGEDFVSFSTDLNYSVYEKTPVRLTIRQMQNQTPFLDLILSSMIINLQP